MNSFFQFPVWKEAPFLRLLLPFISGLLLQWHFNWPAAISWWLLAVMVLLLCILSYTPLAQKFRFAWLTGIVLHFLLLAFGALLLFYHDVRHHPAYFQKSYAANKVYLLVTVTAPLTEKPKSWCTTARVDAVITQQHTTATTGKLILYFQKDSLPPNLHYNNQLLITRPLTAIKNSGNPGSFDYRRYCAFNNIFDQVFLKPGDWIAYNTQPAGGLQQLLFSTTDYILQLLRTYIPGKKEAGLAAALLIGYKQDLDKDLVQSYSDTGVVHVIAISGLHLGLIYWLLSRACQWMKKRRYTNWLPPLLIITGLWLFSFLAGASPSVLRSAVMFTCLVLGNSMARHASVYNSLCASAFLLLCYNPFWLWDAGFLLSYAAVVSLVLFMQPIYHLLYIKNKWLDKGWQLVAVTLAAQVLTIPLCLYYFHQFPVFFLLTNLVAVPLSSLILLIEILLCLTASFTPAAFVLGNFLSLLIRLLNGFIEGIGRLPFATLDNLQINHYQLILLFIVITGATLFLLQQQKAGLYVALYAMLGVLLLRTVAVLEAKTQARIIVYNVPGYRALDVLQGTAYAFYGDSLLENNRMLQRFHLKPARLLYRATDPAAHHNAAGISPQLLHAGRATLLVVDKPFKAQPTIAGIAVDVLLLSGNPRVQIHELTAIFHCGCLVFDSSNPAWKIRQWKQACDSLGLRCHAVTDDGAFVLNGY